MKIQTQNDVININDITEEYLVVAVIDKHPCILGKGYRDDSKDLCFFTLNVDFTQGNGYDFSEEEDTIQKMVKEVLKEPKSKIEAFHQDNWKEALQWLIDNAEEL